MGYTDLTSNWVYKGPITTAGLTAQGQNDLYIKTLLSAYRRPTLIYVDATHLDVEKNIGAANATTVVFPDGETRTVAEDTTTGSPKYRRLSFSTLANFTSGTEASGYFSASYLSAGFLVWSIYAVKSQINSSNFVLVADKLPPQQTNVATLNTQYGANSWIYLGSVYFFSSTMLEFRQTGNFFKLKSSASAGVSGAVIPGQKIGNASSATNLPLSLSASIFGNLPPMAVLWHGCIFAQTTTSGIFFMWLQDNGLSRTYAYLPMATSNFVNAHIVGPLPIESAINLKVSAASLCDSIAISLVGWTENVLAVGSNPFL